MLVLDRHQRSLDVHNGHACSTISLPHLIGTDRLLAKYAELTR